MNKVLGWLLPLLVLLPTPTGCTPRADNALIVQADNIESLPPIQIQRALKLLSSSNAHQQLDGLEFVERFSSLAQTHRELLTQLAQDGASPAVKKKANQLLQPAD